MKVIKKCITSGLILTLAIGSAFVYADTTDDASVSKEVVSAAQTNQLKIAGVVNYNELESGFYEVDGYRLVGEYDFSKYKGQTIIVTGELDTSPSIYMTKAIKVDTLEVVPTGSRQEDLEQQISRSQEQMKYINDNMAGFITQYGKDSSEVRHYKEELEILQNDVIVMLEELILLDGQEVDFAKYKELGKFIKNKDNKVSVFINGKKLIFDVNPVIKNGKTLVPFRAIAESLGAEVSWDSKIKKVTVKKNGTEIVLSIGVKTAYVAGEPVQLDVPAQIVSNTTMIPLRFVSESLKTKVEWIPEGKLVVINELVNGRIHVPNDIDFTVKYKGNEFKLGDWDTGLESILGKPVSEKVEQLGSGADTFTGSYIKTQEYDGLKLGLMSPKDNGKTFFIDNILITKDSYVTSRGFKAGDSYKKIFETYVYNPQDHLKNYDPANHTYTLNDGSTKYVSFEVENGIIMTINLIIEYP